MENPIKAIRQYITQYTNLRFQEFRLEAIERLVNVMGYFIFASVIFILSVIMFGFAAFGLAEWLCYLFDSRTLGYFTVAGIVLLCLILLFVFKNAILKKVKGKILWVITQPKSKPQHEDIDD